MRLEQAERIAERVKAELTPHCERIEIAGSIRRRRREAGDIEVVCIPKVVGGGLFGDLVERSPEFCRVVDRWEWIKGRSDGKYTQRRLPDGINLDLFTARAENWGLILAIRTGSADYSHNVLATGWVRRGYASKDGMLRRGDETVVVREERDLFDLIGVPWVDPERRI
jgi:DNA polymerase/3'-5' exonuclease PolX